MTKLIPKPAPKPDEEETKPKKEFTPKVRNAGHFLFERDVNGLLNEVASYPDLKSFLKGVKEEAEIIPDGDKTPRWIYFRGKFEEVKIERIRDVKVRL